MSQPAAPIPRRLLLGNPARSAGTISPDGRWLGYCAPVDGVLNVWVAPADRPDEARAVTHDRHRGVRIYGFAHTGEHLVYLQDADGDENTRLFVLTLATGEVRALTPAGAKADLVAASPDRPTEVAVTLNDRDPQWFDVVVIDLVTGATRRTFENDRFMGVLVDDRYEARFGASFRADGGATWFRRTEAGWDEFVAISQIDSATTELREISRDGRRLTMTDSRDRDTAALVVVDLETGARRVVHEDPHADVDDVLFDPVTRDPVAVSVEHLRPVWTALEPETAADLARLQAAVGDASVKIPARTLDKSQWVVIAHRPDAPLRYHRYDRAAGRLTPWFDTRPDLAPYALGAMHPAMIRSRDGLDLVSYLSLPVESDPGRTGRPSAPLPMVLLVHGGPWWRDAYLPNPQHWLLADRGYAVLSVNFRGSTGFGKAFLNAGDREWGRKMHDDLLDAVDWAVAQGVAQRDKVAIMGGSYGGYAALAGLTLTPEVFACGIDLVGPSSLITFMETIPPYWEPARKMLEARVGDPKDPAERAMLVDRSPLTHVQRIRRPLLIAQGANDPRVKQSESDQIVAAMQANGIDVTYLLYPDEGHGFVRPENNLSFAAATEAFLARWLGGRAEPVGDAFVGSSVQVLAGRALVEGIPG